MTGKLQSRDAFEETGTTDFVGERAPVSFLEAAHSALEELAGDELSNRYFILPGGLIDKFGLRYDLRRPCTMRPTLPGMSASLVRDLRASNGALAAIRKQCRRKHRPRDIRRGPGAMWIEIQPPEKA